MGTVSGSDPREVTGCFLMFALLFRQVSGEGDDVCIDLLGAGAGVLAIGVSVGCHVGLFK